jgi:hypothetical protein
MLLAAATACVQPPRAPAATAVGDQAPDQGGVARNAIIDLGQVPFNQQSDAIFELTNTSGQPIHLTGAPTVQMLEGC